MLGGLDKITRKNLLEKNINYRKLDFIGIQETIKAHFSKTELHNLCGGRNFDSKWSQPRGRSREVLVGVNCDNFDIIDVEVGIHFIRILVFDKKANLTGI